MGKKNSKLYLYLYLYNLTIDTAGCCVHLVLNNPFQGSVVLHTTSKLNLMCKTGGVLL